MEVLKLRWTIKQIVDLSQGYQCGVVPDVLMIPGDEQAHTWTVEIMENGQAVDLSGCTVNAFFVRGDGKTVFIVGSVDANSASVVLAHECYAIAGLLRGIMKILKSDSVVSICEAFFTVRESIPGQYIDPGDVVPSIEDILQQMDSLAQLGENVSEAESLRVQAESERVEAEQKRDEAVAQIVQNAESGVYDGATFTPAVSAEGVISWTNDKGLANPQSVNIKGADGLSVELQQDGEYLQWRQSEGAWQNLVELSAITGPAGADGTSPTISIGTVVRAETTSEASATFTGTYPAYVLNLVLPKGDTGATGPTGETGPAGADGVSPTVDVSKSGKITTITITDAQGAHTATIHDGADGSGTGDMLKATYDADGDGVVDDAERLGGQLPTYYAPAATVPSVPAWALSDTKPAYTAEEVGAAAAEHTHEQADVTGLSDALAGKLDASRVTISQTDLEEGTSALADGALYFVYEEPTA